MARRYGMTNEDMDGKRRGNKLNVNGMIPNNGMNASPIKEDWSEPALLPRGCKEYRVDQVLQGKHKSGRTDDLSSGVERKMREDQRDFDSLTDPTNW